MGLLDGKVAIVTGAGGGLGRTHALALAKEGAKVVVNDLGGARDGSGTSSAMASQVADEIKKAGGQAVANFDSVSDPLNAEKIIKSAITAFGRLDILVNNAGILRDKTLLKMDDEQWRLVMAVHLDGTFYCGRAAARYMSENGIKGRIINTTSYSGLKGNYGQCNYGAAKAGIAALTKIWALELSKFGINVNAIAPMAKTRMTEDIDAVGEDVKPEHVSPSVVYLASDLSSSVNGRIFGVHGRHIFEYKTEITDGVKRDTDWTASEIASQIDAIAAVKSAGASSGVSGGEDSGIAGRIRRAFELMKIAFTPEASSGWNATMHFFIEGADSYTVSVKDKSVNVQSGIHGAPTCKINTSADTMAGMIEGKTSGQQAFMAGKIKANNLADMMKFGKVFDFKRARDAAAASAPTSSAQASGDSGGIGGRIKRAFELMKVAFTPEAASGWNAVMHFNIDGADSYTVAVKDKAVTVQPGLQGSPSCKIDVSADTMAGMIEGKTSGQQAFMAGKIKANNLGDMMKFGKVFDFKKAREAAGSSGAAIASPTQAAVNFSTIFEKLPDVFLPEATAGWNGKVSLDIAGTSGWTVAIENRKCTITSGKDASATCTVTGGAKEFAETLTGKMDFNAASTKGLLKASNPMALIKFNKAFDWKSPKLTASQGAEGEKAQFSGINPTATGRKYRSPAVLINPDHIRAFAAATNDPNPHYQAKTLDKDLIAPPVFPVAITADLFRQMLADDMGVDLTRLVHGEQTIQYFSPLRALDLVTPRGSIVRVDKKGDNEILHFEQRLYRDGELVTQVLTSLFVRGKKSATPGAKPEEKKPEPALHSEKPTFTFSVKVAEDQTKRYAEVSGDHNPIHLDPEMAKAAGFPGCILHGLCTMAFTGNAIVEKFLDRDMTRLKELFVRFSKPVFLGETLTINGYKKSDGTLSFTALNPQGVAVITNGVAKYR